MDARTKLELLFHEGLQEIDALLSRIESVQEKLHQESAELVARLEGADAKIAASVATEAKRLEDAATVIYTNLAAMANKAMEDARIGEEEKLRKLLGDVDGTIARLINEKIDSAKDRIEGAAGEFEKIAVGATEKVRKLAEKATPSLVERFLHHILYVGIGAVAGSVSFAVAQALAR